jgi:hypothetical protein
MSVVLAIPGSKFQTPALSLLSAWLPPVRLIALAPSPGLGVARGLKVDSYPLG